MSVPVGARREKTVVACSGGVLQALAGCAVRAGCPAAISACSSRASTPPGGAGRRRTCCRRVTGISVAEAVKACWGRAVPASVDDGPAFTAALTAVTPGV